MSPRDLPGRQIVGCRGHAGYTQIDPIGKDSGTRTVDVNVSAETLAARRAAWEPRQPTYWDGRPIKRGVLAQYARLVSCASKGAFLS